MDHELRTKLARKSLQGVSIGDAFGESFFGETNAIQQCIARKEIPATTWEFTDDTVMSLAVFEELERHGRIDQESLVQRFIANHDLDPNRGYGATARRILREINAGGNWTEVSNAAFEGMGSMGNGSSMRVNTIGAYHFDKIDLVRTESEKSSMVTHTHPEAISGAIAVAVATALATQVGLGKINISGNEFIDRVCAKVPASDLKSKINKSLSVPSSYKIETVKSILGNGSQILAKDTVPFVIWCASHNLGNFEHALWKAVSILGDRDTICAMVAGIVVMSADNKTVPEDWLSSVENVDTSPFRYPAV